MSKTKLLFVGWICALLIGCSSPADTPPTAAVATVAETVPTPQSDGGTDIIAATEPSADSDRAHTAIDSDPVPTATAVTLNTVVPAATPTAEATQLPVEVDVPVLENIRFINSQTGLTGVEFEVPNEIRIWFDYANVLDDSIFKRDWYFNDALLISREEAWDGEQYGPKGERADVSIFDLESGLAPGQYRVELFLDGVQQTTKTFSIVPVNTAPGLPEDQRFTNLVFEGVSTFTIASARQFEQPNEVFAIWLYRGMLDGTLVRRDWYFNDELFISKEENWDIDIYGEGGFRTDVSIYDYEVGLREGDYRLELFIDGELKANEAFTVVPPYTLTSLTEPVSGKRASSEGFNTVVVNNPDGSQDQVALGGRIQSVDWFPGGDKMIISTKKVVDPDSDLLAFAHAYELWLWDLKGKSVINIGTVADNFQLPVVSPDGNTIAVLAGSGYGDACVIDLRLTFLKMDGLSVTEKISTEQLAIGSGSIDSATAWTIHEDEGYREHQIETLSDEIISSGSWIDSNRFSTTFGFTDCSDNYGNYEVNLSELTAKKVE
ncbi:MAG: hypothetical protein AB8G95_02510 [Anaerolineae bacterium]